MLDEEEREDTELRERFKEKWNRQPSNKLTESLRKEVKSIDTYLIILYACVASVVYVVTVPLDICAMTLCGMDQ